MSVAVYEISGACVFVSEVFSCCRKLMCTSVNFDWKGIGRGKGETLELQKN